MPGKMYLVNDHPLKYWKNHSSELMACCSFSIDGYDIKDIFHIMRLSINPPCCLICGKPSHHHFGNHFRQYCSTSCQNQSHIVRQKVITTNQEKYGQDYFQQTDQFKCIKKDQRKPKREKVKHLNAFSRKDVQEKIKQTNLERYGVENPSQSKIVQEKIKQTNLERYGGMTLSSPMLIEKVKQTNLERYGVENPSQSKIVQEKIKQTNLERYGVASYNQSQIVDKAPFLLDTNWWDEQSSINEIKDQLARFLSPTGIYSYTHRFRPDLIGTGFSISLPHQSIINLLEEHCVDCIINTRKIISPLELDIYIPSHNIAIEVNGVYWHSEVAGGKGKDYHLNKTLECEKHKIRLLQFWDTEIINKWDIVSSMILNRLEISKNKIGARKCQIVEVSKSQEKEFLNSNHLQGYRPSAYCLGLCYTGRIVALMSFGKPRYTNQTDWELLRFCNEVNTRIVGGASKLFNQRPKGSCVSYSDRRYSQGNMYHNLGFIHASASKPAYHYTRNFTGLENRMKYQKHKLSNQLDSFDPSLIEWET